MTNRKGETIITITIIITTITIIIMAITTITITVKMVTSTSWREGVPVSPILRAPLSPTISWIAAAGARPLTLKPGRSRHRRTEYTLSVSKDWGTTVPVEICESDCCSTDLLCWPHWHLPTESQSVSLASYLWSPATEFLYYEIMALCTILMSILPLSLDSSLTKIIRKHLHRNIMFSRFIDLYHS